MTFPSVTSQNYPTEEEVLNAMLGAVRFGYSKIGINLNVQKGTEIYYRYKAVAARVAVLVQNNKLSTRDISPLDATGDALVELAGVFNVSKRPATAAAGNVIPDVTTILNIPAGFAGTSAGGIGYETTGTVTINPGGGEVVQIQATSTGSETELDAGDIITWDSAAIGGLKQTAVVAPGGIDGGADEDDEETLRLRLLRKLGLPSVGGNSAHVIEVAEGASAAVQKAFVYPALRGPGSQDVALLGEGGDRSIADTTVNSVASAVVGEFPGFVDTNTTESEAEYLDIIINADLPLPVLSGGAGNGWRDGTPWPTSSDTGYAEVTSIASLLTAGQITVNSTDTPIIGNHFGIWNPTTEVMAEFVIANVSGSSGAYVITIDTGQSDSVSFIETGMFCSAGAVNLKEYASQFLAAMESLGPGEKTDNLDLLPRASRIPRVDVEFPYALTTRTLKDILTSNDEVDDLNYAARWETGTAITRTAPSTPSTTLDPPNVLVLKHLAIRRTV